MTRTSKRFPCATSLLLSAATLLVAACGDAEPTGPSILLVTLDTTRADHLSCYGYGKRTTPRIDQLATDAVRYENAYAVTSWTLPSHASIFTGKFPSSHGSMYSPTGKINLVMPGGIKGNPAWDNYKANPIARDEITLAQLLAGEGYATGAVVAGPWLKKVFGLNRGFQSYDDSNFVDMGQGMGELNGRTAEDVTRAAMAFVDAHAKEPFFLFLNYYDPHSPYSQRPEYLQNFWKGDKPAEQSWEWTLALYDSEIQYTDHHFGRLLDHLKQTGLYEDMWIMVTSDHGELMGEHGGAGHGDSLSEEEIHIPLIVKEPGAQRRRGTDARLVQQVDLMPTLLDRLGLPLPGNMQGAPLDRVDHPIVAEVYPLPMMNNARKPIRQLGDWQMWRKGNHKLVWGNQGTHYLFDIAADPKERKNLFDSEPELAASMREEQLAYFASLPKPGEVGDVRGLTAEELRELKGMGYIGGEDE